MEGICVIMENVNNKKIAVLIPCYNEAITIMKVINDFKKYLPEADIYVYDNNSTDGTDKIAQECGAIVRYENKQGKGNVVRSMFRDISADCYIMVDGDDTYSVENARELVNSILIDGYDMIIGDRLTGNYFEENKRLFHSIGNKLIRYMINELFRSNIHDIMTGYRAFSYGFVKTFPALSKGFEIETEMTIHAIDKNMKIKEIPISFKERKLGSISKLNTFRDGFKVIKTIGTLFKEYRPRLFFNSLAIIFWAIAIIMAYPVFQEYFKTGLVPRFPTLIASGVLAQIGLLLNIAGIILQVIYKKHRQLFEIHLNEAIELRKELERINRYL